MTPRQVFERLLAGFGSDDWSNLHELYAPDAEVSMPFALPEPVHLHGRHQIRAHLARNAAVGITFRVSALRLHETADPEVVIGEFDYDGSVARTGKSFHVANVQVIRVRDGLIVETRDYHNHKILADVLA